MSLSLLKAHLIGWFVESLSYGVYFMVFLECMQALRRRRYRSSYYLIGTAVSLFILATIRLLDDFVQIMDGFTSNAGTLSYPFTRYTAANTTWRNIVRGVVYVTATIISDGFLLYRSFVVWDQSYFVLAIPFMLFLADIALGIFWVYAFVYDSTEGNFFEGPLAERLEIFYGITFSMNVVCTCLIALKVWKIQRAVAPFLQGSRNKTSRLVPMIIESCCVYSLFLVIILATHSEGSMAMFIFLDPMCSIIGIVFSSLIVRIGSGLSHGDYVTESRTQLTATAIRQQSQVELPFTPSTAESFPDQVPLSQHAHIDEYPMEELETGTASTKAEYEGFDDLV